MEPSPSMAGWLAARFVPGWSSAHERPVDLRAFRALGHRAARAAGGRFVDDPLPGVCKSHERALVVLPAATVRVLVHHEVGLVAFAAHRPEAPVDLVALEAAVGERNDLRYWAPRRIGDVLFNLWD